MDPLDLAALPETLPVLPLRNAVIFPAGVLPVAIGRPKTVAVARAGSETALMVIAQRQLETEDPAPNDLYGIGVICRIADAVWRSDGAQFNLIGICRAAVKEWTATEPFLRASFTLHEDTVAGEREWLAALRKAAHALLDAHPRLPRHVRSLVEQIDNPLHLADLLAANALESIDDKQVILEAAPAVRVERVLRHVARLTEVARTRPLTAHDRWLKLRRWLRL